MRPEQEDELVEWFRANEMFYDQTRRDFEDKHTKKDRLLNVKGNEMGISGEYRLEYMPLMIQEKKQVEFRIAMIGWARLSFLFFFTLDVSYLYITVPRTWDVFMYTMC